MSDSSSLSAEDSSNDGHTKQRNRRRKNDTGVYGGWNDDGSGSDFEDEDANGKSLYSSSRGGVSFVASAGPSRPAEAQDEESEEEDSDDAMDESEEEPIQPNISMEEDEDEEEDSRPRLGLGSQQPLANQFPTQFTSTNASVQRGANSSKRPSLGATSKAPTWKAPAKDFAKFEKHTKGIGSKLLSKMGYVPGQGLGADGSGIVEPIDVRQRPQKMGLGHGGFDERTDSARKEQEAKKTQKTQKERAAMDAPAWKKGFVDDEDREKGRQFKRRPKKTYVSAADLVADSLGAEEVPSGVKETKILDLTGPQARVLDNISQISNRGATAIGGGNDYLKELKYNLGILADTYQAELLRSARAMGDLKKRQRITKAELANVNDKNSKDAKLLADLERLSILLKEIQLLKKGIASSAIPTWVSTKSAFKDAFSRLKTESTSLKDEQMGGGNLMGLDTIVVAAVAPALKALFQRWEVLEEPDLGVQVLSEWIPLLDPQGILSPVGVTNQRPMTPYENLLYSFWLPRVRQAITNSWTPKNPDAMVILMEAWDPLLPRWLHHNIYEQLLAPKIRTEIEAWDLRVDHNVFPHIWLFPWLPIVGDKFHLTGVWETIRVRMSGSLGDWHPRDPRAIAMLSPWKQVFSASELEALVHRAILPKLVQVFRLEFTINPAAQDLNPLEWALQWVAEGLLSVPIAVHLLETEMFPKWQKVLWAWLTSPSVVFEEVSGWYSSWKALLPPELLPSLQHQFRFGLDMMNQALMGGPGALQVMPPPPVPLAHQPSVDEKNQKTQARKAAMGSDTTPTTLPPKKPQLSFVDYLQRAAADQGIEFLPLVGKSHPVNGRPLYKLSGKSHLTVYIDQGLLFVRSPGSSDWEPMSVDEAVSRASQ